MENSRIDKKGEAERIEREKMRKTQHEIDGERS